MNDYSYSFADENEKKALVALCEADFRSKLDAAAELASSQENLKFIALSGPTCSGKTTTAGILIDKLQKKGKRVTVISIDDFFLDRATLAAEAERTGVPFDMDSVKAIDLGELRAFVADIAALRPARLPKFDFAVGGRVGYTELFPDDSDIYIFEGIQAVYPEVTVLFERKTLLKIYISVEDGISSPWGSWLPREIRLLRRLVRDSKFRNTDAETTFAHWGGVVSNELVNIEPYKDGCDVRLNSGMIYEICVLKDPLIEVLN